MENLKKKLGIKSVLARFEKKIIFIFYLDDYKTSNGSFIIILQSLDCKFNLNTINDKTNYLRNVIFKLDKSQHRVPLGVIGKYQVSNCHIFKNMLRSQILTLF